MFAYIPNITVPEDEALGACGVSGETTTPGAEDKLFGSLQETLGPQVRQQNKILGYQVMRLHSGSVNVSHIELIHHHHELLLFSFNS